MTVVMIKVVSIVAFGSYKISHEKNSWFDDYGGRRYLDGLNMQNPDYVLPFFSSTFTACPGFLGKKLEEEDDASVMNAHLSII